MNRGLPVLNLPEVAILGADHGARPLWKGDENVFSVKDRNTVVPESSLLLVSVKNHDLRAGPTPRVLDSQTSCQI